MGALSYGSSGEPRDTSATDELPRKRRVMIIDEDVEVRTGLSGPLTAAGYDPVAIDVANAVQRYQDERPAAVILDIGDPDTITGLRTLRALKGVDRRVPIIILSTLGLTPSAIEALGQGAAFLVRKPVQPEGLVERLTQMLEERASSRGGSSTSDSLRVNPRHSLFLGQSSQMAHIFELIERAGHTHETVLIRGERGTGKELVARAVAAVSDRKTPFVKVNCATIRGDLLEAQLIGFDDGPFVNPDTAPRKRGAFMSAQQGTLFLDEVGAIPAPLQGRLLRLLDDEGALGSFGSRGEKRSRARVIAATAQDLHKKTAEGCFSQGLLLRLSEISITVPALRERREDIPALITHFLEKHAAQQRKPVPALDAGVVQRLTQYEWPGNVRELESVLRRAVVLGPDFSVDKELAHKPRPSRHRSSQWLAATEPSAPRAVAQDSPSGRDAAAEAVPVGIQTAKCSLKAISREAARRAERDLILRVLQRTHWNRKAAAGLLQISYKALLYKIKENGLDDDPL